MRVFITAATLLMGIVTASAQSSDRIAADGGDIVITPIVHSSVQIEHAGTVIQIDPWSEGDLSLAKPADLILVTDDPGHHLDPAAITQLRKPGAPVVLTATAHERFPDGFVVANGERGEFAGVSVEAVLAYDMTPGQPFHPKGEANGYVVTLGGKRIFVAGVTECVPEIRAIDLMPTLLALSGLSAPEEIQGQSLLPLMGGPVGDEGPAEEWVVRPAGSERDLGDGRSVSLVSDGWKIVQTIEGDDEADPEFELFDHREDPLNLVNLADEHPDIVERLTQDIDRWLRQSESAQLTSDEELSSELSADELKRLRGLGYVR